ncbi:hypothetical protein D3C79_414820 [compost metagenome]
MGNFGKKMCCFSFIRKDSTAATTCLSTCFIFRKLIFNSIRSGDRKGRLLISIATYNLNSAMI